MFSVKESHTFSLHDFLKNFYDPSSWGLPSSSRLFQMVSAWNSSKYECKIFVTEQVAGVLSPKLMLPAVIRFRPSLQIQTQKILARVSYPARVKDHTQ